MSFLADIGSAFVLGLLTPLTAVCVLPLYPGFLSYLSSQISEKDSKLKVILLGFLVMSGVLLFMLILGILFSTLLKQSLTEVIGIISPIAFFILGIISIFLIIDYDFGRFLPKVTQPNTKNPYLSALLFGFFFGAIVVPCNPGFIIAFLTLVTINPVNSILSFIAFGLGIGIPLFLLSVLSASGGKTIIRFMIRNKTNINRFAGIIMLIISIYYLFFIFKVQKLIF